MVTTLGPRTRFKLAGCVLLLAACAPDSSGSLESQAAANEADSRASWVSPLSAEELKRVLRLSPVPAAPLDPTNRVSGNSEAAELGRHLFHSRALSKGSRIACATCHDPRDSFVDGKKLAEGVMGLERHTPTLWNVAHQRWFFWDGRADSLWAQALVPIEDPLEHAFTRAGVAHAIYSDPGLREMYEGVFGEMPKLSDTERFPLVARPVPEDDRAHQLAAAHALRANLKAGAEPGATGTHHTHLYGTGFYHPHQRAWDGMQPEDQDAITRVFVDAGKAMAAFQERIVAGSSAFDRFVEGLREHDPAKTAALDESALRGLRLFLGRGQCIVCHHGPLLTDYEFHDTQIPSDDSLVWQTGGEGEVPVGAVPPNDLGRVHGIERLRASEFGVGSRWSDDPTGPQLAKVDYLPRHLHEGSPEFKTPTLRNVALTAPYMHNGAFETLEEVVEFYSTRAGARRFGGQSEKILQPLNLSPTESSDLVAFLLSLSDDASDLTLLRAPK